MRFGQFPGCLAGRFGRSDRAAGLLVLPLYSAGHHAHSLYGGGRAGRPANLRNYTENLYNYGPDLGGRFGRW